MHHHHSDFSNAHRERRLIRFALSGGVPERLREVPPSLDEKLSETDKGYELNGADSYEKKRNLEDGIGRVETAEAVSNPEDYFRNILNKIENVLDDPDGKKVVQDILAQGDEYVQKIRTKENPRSEAFPEQQFIENPDINNMRLAQGGIEIGGIEKLRFVFVTEKDLITDKAGFERNIPKDEQGNYDLGNVYLRTPEGRIALKDAAIKDGSSSIMIVSLPASSRMIKRYATLSDDRFEQNEKMYRIFGNSGADVVTALNSTTNGVRGTVTRAQTLGDDALEQKGGEAIANTDGELAGIQASTLAGASNFDGTANFIPASEIRRELLENGINPDLAGGSPMTA